MDTDDITIEFLPDGRVKVTTDEISPANHMTAEKFVAELGRLLGGEVTKTRATHKVVTTHNHIHIGGS